ncbi:MAG: cytochrome c oxidase subunit II, partial [bacterium]
MILKLLPPSASTTAEFVDPILKFLFYISLFFVGLIVMLATIFVMKYRRKEEKEWVANVPSHNLWLEITWISIPTIIVLVLFFWGFRGFLHLSIAPDHSYQIKVTGQKWFWSFDYPEGVTTVNQLVVPQGRSVKLLLSSRDVIHSFFVPAFRIKRDVLPNRYTIAWFNATRIGEYPLFCAEYCGTEHSKMVGTVKIVEEIAFSSWIDSVSRVSEGLSLEEWGSKLFVAKACYTCHSLDGTPG